MGPGFAKCPQVLMPERDGNRETKTTTHKRLAFM